MYRIKKSFRRIIFLGLVLVLFGGVVFAAKTEDIHNEVWKAVKPAIVAVKCDMPSLGEGMVYYGTGVIIKKNGLILTITGVVPPKAENITVTLHTGETFPAEVVFSDNKKEIVLLAIKKDNLPFLSFADSDKIKVGDGAYSIGNVLGSMTKDSQVSLAFGFISGKYNLGSLKHKLEKLTGKYKGEVIETTAAINGGVDGGPLISAGGEIAGILILSYSKSRWLGLAIPSNEIKKTIDEHVKSFEKIVYNFPELISFAKLVDDAADSVVGIKVEYKQKPKSPDYRTRESLTKNKRLNPEAISNLKDYSDRPDELRSGVVIDAKKGYILTSYNNVKGKIKSLKIVLQKDKEKKEFDAEIIGWYQDLDLVLLKTDKPINTRSVIINNENNIKLGQWTIVVSVNPDKDKTDPLMTAGIVSAEDRLINGKCFQIDAAINYANIGAPVFDIDGKFLGMTGQFARPVEWGLNSGIGLAVKANEIGRLLDDLKKGKKKKKTPSPFLGVQLARGALDIKGVKVDQVVTGSAAYDGGVEQGDIIVGFNGHEVTSWPELIKHIRETSVGDKIILKVKRGEKVIKLNIKLGQR